VSFIRPTKYIQKEEMGDQQDICVGKSKDKQKKEDIKQNHNLIQLLRQGDKASEYELIWDTKANNKN